LPMEVFGRHDCCGGDGWLLRRIRDGGKPLMRLTFGWRPISFCLSWWLRDWRRARSVESASYKPPCAQKGNGYHGWSWW